MKIKAYVTDQNGKRLEKISESLMQYKNTDAIEQQNHPGDIEAFLVNIHPDIEYQTVGGIGGAFTDASAAVWQGVLDGKKEEFVKPNAKVISSSSYDSNLESVAFKNSDGSIVTVLLNRSDRSLDAIIRINGEIESLTLSPHSILTAVLE